MIGTVLGGRYTILEEVGKGGMAHVYKAQCNVLNRIVAVKVLRNDLEGGDEFIRRFNAEAQSAACLTHPNIVSIYDVGEEDGMYYIVMEYIEGVTLKEYIKTKGTLSSVESAEIASQICAALSIAHEKNIIHRDIKPHNIMVTNDNLIKVTDFGIARASNNATMQVGDSILGSVHYISPEQARGGYVDGRSDIYSLGIVLYEMLTGKVPFESESPIAIAMKHLEEIPVSPKTLSPDISSELQDVVLKAMSKETRKRYQSVGAMKSDLDIIINILKTAGDNDAAYDEEEIYDNSDDEAEDNTSLRTIKDNADYEYEDEEYDDSEYNDEEYDEDFDDEYEDEDHRKISFNMVITALLISVIVVGAASFAIGAVVFPDAPFFVLVKSFFNNSDVTVPELVGKNFKEAITICSNLGLKTEETPGDFGPEPAGVITFQSYNEGALVKKGSVITLRTSKGPDPERFNTDEFKGRHKDEINKLIAEGYTNIEIVPKTDVNAEENTILEVRLTTDKILFYVNTDEQFVELATVPDLSNMTVDEARAALQASGLLLKEDGNFARKESTSVPEGKVVSQSERPGTQVEPKTEIKIYLAVKPASQNEDANTSNENNGTDANNATPGDNNSQPLTPQDNGLNTVPNASVPTQAPNNTTIPDNTTVPGVPADTNVVVPDPNAASQDNAVIPPATGNVSQPVVPPADTGVTPVVPAAPADIPAAPVQPEAQPVV